MAINEVKGIRWRVSHDLGGGLSARTFDVAYTKVGALNVWDSGQYDQIELYRGEAAPDLIRIKAEWDGDERDVILGVVDRSGREQTDEGVAAHVIGRDKAALVLDRFPAAAFTLQGNDVVDNVLVPNLTYREAVEEVADQAGLTVSWNVGTDDYNLGRSIAVTTDQSFGKIIAQLMEPWRFGEKYSHDAWVSDDGLVLHVVRRNLLGSVNVDFNRMTVNRYEKRVLPDINDVRVEGQSYETVVASGTLGLCDPIFPETFVRSFGGGLPSQNYTETTKVYKNTVCQVTKVEITQQYADNLKTVVKTVLFTYWSAPGTPKDGKVKTQTYEHRETNSQTGAVNPLKTDGTQGASVNVTFSYSNVLRESMTKEFDYYSDNGDTKTTDESHEKADRPVGPTGLDPTAGGLVADYRPSHRTFKQFTYARGVGQTYRIVAVQNHRLINERIEPTNNEVQVEIPPYTVSEATLAAVNQGFKQETVTLSAGGEDAKRVEQSDLLGDQTSIDLIRTRLLEEQDLKIVEASVNMLPDHLVKPGWTLVIEGAPSWFDISSLYILSSDIDADEHGAIQMLRCIGFLS
jgi:hypothetical protein